MGDGTSICVWTDKWIPGTISIIPQVQPSMTSIEKVSELIDIDTWSWRQDVVRDIFSPSNTAAILNIPIRQGGGEDFLAWAFDKSGNYIVKMAYRALVTQEELRAQEEGRLPEPHKTINSYGRPYGN
ncbi:Alanyl-tRNA synthetase [Hordeum vulgare]|nr:Alanyl-tRNA synthetase [Hordeum vulgare]